MIDITVSEFTIEAYEDVFRLWEACDGIGLSNADSESGIRMYLERNPGLSLVARDGRKAVGTILCGHDGRRGYIHHLAVLPNYRRQGIGRKLVDKALCNLHALSIQKCHLFIFHDNTGGIKFWESIGWTFRQDIGVVSKMLD